MCYGEVISSQMQKARKEHVCSVCEKKISPNETYHYEKGRFEGEFYTFKAHKRCRRLNDIMWSEYGQDMCYTHMGEALHEEAKTNGWRYLLSLIR